MPGGLPSLRWSSEPKRRKIIVVAGVDEVSCLSASTSSVSQPSPELTSGRSGAPLLRPSTRGDRGVALSSASTATTRKQALDGLLAAMSARSAASSQESMIKTWTSFHMAWFGPSVEVLPLVPAKVFAVCAMFRAGGYRSVENYLSRIKDLHVEEGFDWSMSLERAFRKSKRAVNRGIGPARQSAALDLGAAFKALENRSSAPVCNRGPVGLRNLLVVGCFWMLRELEISCAKVCHLEVDAVHFWVDWTLPASKTDVRALGKVRRWECVCSGDFTRPCPFHASVNQFEILRSSHRGEGSSPLFPTISGGFVDKRHVVTSIEFVARLIGEALTGSGGVRRFGGHSLRVTGARLMAGMGISIVLIQLMARWSSEAVLRYVAEAPLQGMSDAYRKGLSTSALGTSAEETSRQLEVVKSETAQDKRLIHYLQQEVATLKAIEDVKVKDMGYIVNTESGVVHRPVVWAKDVVPIHWRTACGWAFGFSQYDVSLVSPVGAVFCRGCSGQRNKAVSCSEAPSNTSNSTVLSDSSNFSCSSPD